MIRVSKPTQQNFKDAIADKFDTNYKKHPSKST
jgi:hypothetical protein